jgi:molecular chaperone DnaJ
MPKDYYQILGIEKGAPKDEIKKAFRKKAHEYHPDKEGGDEAKFKEVNEAYQVLSDDTKRQQYDQFGQTFDGGGGGGFPGGGFPGGAQGMNFDDLGEMFGDMFGGAFGGGGRRTQRPRGNDILVDVELSFKESVFGVEKEVTLSKNNACDHCGGVGAEPGSKMDTCSTCDGQGFEIKVQRTLLGAMKAKATCAECSGSGEIPETKCEECHGIGLLHGRKTLRVDIPAGIEDSMKIRVRGEGESIGASGDSGDLFLRVHVREDDRFEREGFDIYYRLEIGFTQAALGSEEEIVTVDGPATLKIPAGIQSGEKLRMKGKGVPHSRGRGDQYVIVIVKTPKRLSKKQKKLMEELGLEE